jgi:hypothetical protein
MVEERAPTTPALQVAPSPFCRLAGPLGYSSNSLFKSPSQFLFSQKMLGPELEGGTPLAHCKGCEACIYQLIA